MTTVTYSEAIAFLYDLRLFGAKFGLENTFKLASLFDNPHENLRFIHVAGTNGKGSTCAMLESIYRAAGLQVGLFTSPHLVSFRERIQVDRQLISKDEVVRLVGEMRDLLNQFPAEHFPTFFEVIAVMALRYFAEQKCDLVIWETGMGGRLDATNIVTPLASVITNVQLDHQQWLGDTLEQIAAEKAGIIKPGVPVLTAADESTVLTVIEEAARRLNAPITEIVQPSRSQNVEMAALPLLGEHQKLNAVLALATVEILQKQILVTEEKIRAGLATVSWPGRMQLIPKPSGKRVLLDGAHNVAGARVLCNALEEYFPGIRRTLILGVLQDKDWRHICDTLSPLAVRLLLVPVQSERTANAGELAAACSAANPAAKVAVCESLSEALESSADDNFVVIAGSLYLVGEALERLGLSPADDGERTLNEWHGAPQPATACAMP